uniref:Uncharacterized protein n=1 Tax=Arundo donax TaxID=35708 RepID=A0A0A9C902_ARUDO
MEEFNQKQAEWIYTEVGL